VAGAKKEVVDACIKDVHEKLGLDEEKTFL
jgi:hypothetical protein